MPEHILLTPHSPSSDVANIKTLVVLYADHVSSVEVWCADVAKCLAAISEVIILSPKLMECLSHVPAWAGCDLAGVSMRFCASASPRCMY